MLDKQKQQIELFDEVGSISNRVKLLGGIFQNNWEDFPVSDSDLAETYQLLQQHKQDLDIWFDNVVKLRQSLKQ